MKAAGKYVGLHEPLTTTLSQASKHPLARQMLYLEWLSPHR